MPYYERPALTVEAVRLVFDDTAYENTINKFLEEYDIHDYKTWVGAFEVKHIEINYKGKIARTGDWLVRITGPKDHIIKRKYNILVMTNRDFSSIYRRI